MLGGHFSSNGLAQQLQEANLGLFLTRAMIYQDFLLWHLHSSCPGASVPWQHLPPPSLLDSLSLLSQTAPPDQVSVLGGSPFKKQSQALEPPCTGSRVAGCLDTLFPSALVFQWGKLWGLPPPFFLWNHPGWEGWAQETKLFRGCRAACSAPFPT